MGLASEEDEIKRNNTQEPLSADLIIVDAFSMVDMWLANKFFSRIKGGARVILVGDPDQRPSVGAGNVFRELIDCGPVSYTHLWNAISIQSWVKYLMISWWRTLLQKRRSIF